MTSPGCSAATLSDVKAVARKQDFAETTNPFDQGAMTQGAGGALASVALISVCDSALGKPATERWGGARGSERRKGKLR